MGRRADRSLKYEVPPPCAGLRAAPVRRRNSHHPRSIRNTPQAMGVTLLKHVLRRNTLCCMASKLSLKLSKFAHAIDFAIECMAHASMT
jgi:hypothetical protein